MRILEINPDNCGDYSYVIPYIRYCAEDRYIAPWTLKQRRISDYEFIYITAGSGQFKIDENKYTVKANDLILIKPGISHSGISLKLPFSFLCVHFDLFVSRSVNVDKNQGISYEFIPVKPMKFQKAVLNFAQFTTVIDSIYVHQLLKRIIHENNKKPVGYNNVIKSLFLELVFHLFRQNGKAASASEIVPEIQEIIDYIKANYMHSIKLADIANHVHLQPQYISSKFKRYSGYTITEYLKLHRIALSKEMLMETGRKIEDIACSIGFFDIHHFSRVFKESTGLTPGQYREMRLS